MVAAVIDLGTNTFHLVIARLEGKRVTVLYRTTIPVRLGEGRINDNIIIPEAFERGLLTLEAFAETINEYQVSQVKAIATSAVRSASNGSDFVQAAFQRAGIVIETITGEQEAEYIFKGVEATGLVKGNCLIMDIGGGSTEFILCKNTKVIWKKSYDIGAARLMQAFFKSDPLSTAERTSILTRVAQLVPDLLEVCRIHQPETLIGSAGAFESFATMLNIKKGIQDTGSSGPIVLEEYKALAETLIRSTHEERVNMEGLIPLRVDMIVIAALLVNYVLDHTQIKNLSLSANDLKMGVLYADIS